MAQTTVSKIEGKTQVLLSAVVATGAGPSYELPAASTVFQVAGITTATVVIQGSLDGTNWVALNSFTADGGYALTSPWKYVRANVTAWTSGTITVTMGW